MTAPTPPTDSAHRLFTRTTPTWEVNDKPIGDYCTFPFNDPHAVATARHDDMRNPARDPLVSFVQSRAITGACLALMAPYTPRCDGPAQDKTRPDPGVDLIPCWK